MTQAQRVCVGFLAALGGRDRLVFVAWLERKEYQDIPEREAPRVLTAPQALQVCRDTVETQDSQGHQGSPEERARRENQDSQDLRLTSAMAAPQFKVRPVTLVVPGYLVSAATKDLQGFQAFQEPRELS